MFASVVSALSNPDSNGIPQSPQLNVVLDKDKDTVMCNNYIGGRETFGYIDPKPMSSTTQLMIPKRLKTAKYMKDSTAIERWANRSVIEMDRCCMEALAYTYVWDKIINVCIGNDYITPCVYHMVYMMMKVMSRTPRIPPGTVLYRGSSVPFDQYTKNMRFMSFTTNIKVARKFSVDGSIGKYIVKETDYIHGIWLDREYGTSNFYEEEIVIGPGIYVDSVSDPITYKHFGPIDTVIAQAFTLAGRKDLPTYTQVYSLELKQQDVGTYFMDNYVPEADEYFRSIVESGCVLLSYMGCFIDSFYKTVFKDWDKNEYCAGIENLSATLCGKMYLGVFNDETATIGLSDEVKFDPESASLLGPKGYIYKILKNDEVTYCTLSELIELAYVGNDVVVLPIEK